MKAPLFVIGALFATAFQLCGSEDDAAPTPKAEGSASAPESAESTATLEAQIGGQLVAVGDHQVELKLFRNGYAEALVFDARGQGLAEPGSAKLVAHARAEGGAKADVKLGWQPPISRFAAEGTADAELEAKPVDVELSLASGKTARGSLDAVVLLVGPEMGGTLVVAGDHGIELLAAADGTVEAIVHDRAGARLNGDAAVKLELELSGADGKLHAVALAWNEARARFTGRVDAAVKLAAGPAKIGIAGKASVKLPKLALCADAEHQGRVVVAGDYSVELVADGDVLVAYAFDASGKAHAKGDLELAVKLGAGAFVNLTWDAPSLSYRAKIAGNLDLNAQPIVVSVKAAGKAHVGASLKANANAKLAAPELDAKLAVSPKASAKGSAKAKLQAPKVKVSAPKVNVQKSASAGTGAKGKASAGFSFGTK